MNVSLLVVIEVIGFTAFLYITLRLLRTYRRLGLQDLFLPSISFLLLSISQLCATLSIIYTDIRISTSLYTATATLAIAAFSAMIMQRHYLKTVYVFTPYVFILMFPDIIAGTLSIYVAINSASYTKVLLFILSSSYYLRAISIAVSIEVSPILLLVAELIRSTSAVALAIYSSIKVLKL